MKKYLIHVSRWNLEIHPTILCALVHNTKAVVADNPNMYLELFTNGFKTLSKGVVMYSSAHKREVKVFAVLHSVYGDLPGRCSIAGLKSGVMASR
jgi:hypothetical protein